MQKFLPNIYGHENIQKLFKSMILNNSLGHSLIFYGDEGLGKTTTAIDLASILTNKIYQNETKEWFLEEFSKYPVLTTSDKRLWYIRPLGLELKLEQFRIFFESMQSFDDQIHICIIDEAQSMMPPVANALLKTLEEPIKGVYFILITHDLSALLPTIISRGELFPFFPLSKKDYIQLLKDFPDKFSLPEDLTYEQAFRLTEGNPGMTLAFSKSGKTLGLKEALEFWCIVTDSNNIFYSLSQIDFKERIEFIRYLKCLRLIAQDLMVLTSIDKVEFIRCINFIDKEKIISKKWSYENICKAIRILNKALIACKRYISIKLIWDMILVEFEHIKKGDIGWKV